MWFAKSRFSFLTSEMGQSLQGVCRPAGPEVRFGPKADLIPMTNPVTHPTRFCNRAKEYGHAGSSECLPNTQASAVEQRQADRGKATAAPQTGLVDPDETPDRRSRSRPRDVQSGNRQQASWL